MRSANLGNSFRGVSISGDVGLGIGGNQPVNATSGAIIGGSRTGEWHPTVLYLLGLLVLEWIAFVCLAKII